MGVGECEDTRSSLRAPRGPGDGWFPTKRNISAPLQPPPVSNRVWPHLPQRWFDDARRDGRNGRRHLVGNLRYHHSSTTARTVSVATSTTNVYTQEKRCDPNSLNRGNTGDEERCHSKERH